MFTRKGYEIYGMYECGYANFYCPECEKKCVKLKNNYPEDGGKVINGD